MDANLQSLALVALGAAGFFLLNTIVAPWLAQKAATAKSEHLRKMAAFGGQIAEEAVLFIEETGKLQGWTGLKKLEEAISIYNKRMEEAGIKVSYETAGQQVQAAVTRLTYDRTTAFNDKTAMGAGK